jgi:RNase adapter protein RapZ
MELVLITGLSGSGKSVALKVLEDSGYYCVDNLPGKLLADLAGHLYSTNHERVALTMDVRDDAGLEDLPARLAELRARNITLCVLYLDAKNDTLIKRFSETRRRHPLSASKLTLPECIVRERELLADIADLANHVDTSDLSPTALRSWVRDFVEVPRTGLTLLFQSFAFKHGIPLDADMVFDVRFLPNPHYEANLRLLTGLDKPVVEFMQANSDAQRLLDDIRGFVSKWLDAFRRDNRSYLTVAIGCTGGHHRSVYFVENLAQAFLTEARAQVLVRHRELA